MSEDFDKLKKQKQEILEWTVCMGTDALRICLGHEPKNFTAEQVIKHIRLMTQPAEGSENPLPDQETYDELCVSCGCGNRLNGRIVHASNCAIGYPKP